ncbi:MAG TPA: undecaprenyl/decaprenyl-phosphate alpha-N-acetylglucosaminyl 1-phosphate transferase [Phycisphaerae bacterium]|nr:undecaprenyl/decaprenyl-phosphate alpha-N-acetylglucosaminyl 1-phosphate transferase [Phycisphaerae bacterium]
MIVPYIVIFVAAVVVSLLVTRVVIHLARSMRLYDSRGPRKVHVTPTPRIGGVGIFVAMMTVTVVAMVFDRYMGNIFAELKGGLIVLFATSAFIFLVGLVDDLRGMRATLKLLGQIIAAVVVCSFGIRIDTIMGVDWMGLSWLSWPITILWILAITNAVNLIDGLDGLSAGICSATCAVIAAFSIYTGQLAMGMLMLGLLGSLVGFLFFNFNPAKIFMGDSGSMFLGFFLATASLLFATKVATLMGLVLPALALGLPIFDMFLTVVRRVLNRQSVFSADRGHIHHRLVDSGLKHHHAVILMYLVTLIIAGAAVLMMVLRGGGELIVFIVALLLLMSVFRVAGVLRFRKMFTQVQENLARSREVRRERRQFESISLRFREAWTFEQWWKAVRRMARRMDFARITITYRHGSEVRTMTYTNPSTGTCDDRLMHLNIPVRKEVGGGLEQVEIEVPVKEPLETIGRRISLFGRLLDEHSLADLPAELGRNDPLAGTDPRSKETV